MIIQTTKGTFELIKNVREAFNQEDFESKYIEECFEKYAYIVGDISGNILRIRGFMEIEDKERSCKMIPDYLSESCAFNCAYYVLKKINKH